MIIHAFSNVDLNTRLDTANLLIEISNNSKTIVSESKHLFFLKLMDETFLRLLIDNVLQTLGDSQLQDALHPDFNVKKLDLLKIHSAEILSICLQIIPEKVKLFLLSKTQEESGFYLMKGLIQLIFYSPLDGLKMEIVELLKIFLDPDSKKMKGAVLNFFYTQILQELIQKLLGQKNEDLTSRLIFDLLRYCAAKHPSRFGLYVRNNEVLQRLSPLHHSPKKYTRLNMLKLVRTLIGNREEIFCRYIAKNDLLRFIVEHLEKTREPNLLTSSIFELLKFISRSSNRILPSYLLEKHKAFFTQSRFASAPVFCSIRERKKETIHNYPLCENEGPTVYLSLQNNSPKEELEKKEPPPIQCDEELQIFNVSQPIIEEREFHINGKRIMPNESYNFSNSEQSILCLSSKKIKSKPN